MITYHDPFPNYKFAAGNIRYSNIFRIAWSPDYFCNYKCSYCWPGYNSPTRSHLSMDILISGLKKLEAKAEKMKINHMYISFAGGEPTLVPNFLDLIKEYNFSHLPNIKKSLGVITNLTQSKKWWENFIESTHDIEHVHISPSWHRESLKDVSLSRKKFAEIFYMVQKANRYRKHKISYYITMVLPPSQFDDIYSDALHFRVNKVPIIIRVERKAIDGKMLMHPDYTDDMIETIVNWHDDESKSPSFFHKDESGMFYYNEAEQPIALGKTNYLGWKCHAGFDYLIIKPNGDIFRGQYCNDKPLGNIKDDFELYEEPKKCITPRCGCSSDMNAIKFLGKTHDN